MHTLLEHLLPFTHTFHKCAQVASRYLHGFVCIGIGVPDTLFLNIRSKRTFCGTHGVTPVVTSRRFLAGFATCTGHTGRDYGSRAPNAIIWRRKMAGIGSNGIAKRLHYSAMTFLNPPFIISILIALSVHEWAHAYAAYKLGDSTAKYAGRLTVNPMAHLDPMGTLMFFIVGFGWAKPVPVDPRYFDHPRRDNAIVALAGPLSNLVLAFIAFIVLMLANGMAMNASVMDLLSANGSHSAFTALIIQISASSLFINLALMAFNLLPIAPLDGSKILHPFIPLRYEREYYEFMNKGPFILLAIIILERAVDFPLLSGWVFGIVGPILWAMQQIALFIF